jgi:hypothetical protein
LRKEKVLFAPNSPLVQQDTLSFFAQKKQKVPFAHTELRRLRGLFIRAIFREKKKRNKTFLEKIINSGEGGLEPPKC